MSHDREAPTAMGVIIGIALVVIVLAATCVAIDDQGAPTRALLRAGYRDVRVERSSFAWPLSGCGEDDAAAHTVSAVNPVGQRVQLLVCCGVWSKACTIRSR